jgi:stalled ribosome rescue protein Dom34
MAKRAGVWIDHKRAVLVALDGDNEEVRELLSNVEGRPRYHGRGRIQEDVAEDQRDKRIAGHLDKYYDQVAGLLRDAGEILIMGPGEAKGELAENLERAGLGGRIVATEAADKMTVRQIAARVRERFSA